MKFQDRPMTIKSLWLRDAVKDDRLKRACQRLRLKDGTFTLWESAAEWPCQYHRGPSCECPLKQVSDVRMFFAEGPKGGISGVLLANRLIDMKGVIRIGVYIDRKNRRKNVATRLVEAARSHYPAAQLRGTAWNEASLGFWNKVKYLTGHEPLLFNHR